MIAVAILVLATAYGAVSYQVKSSESNSENVKREILSITEAVNETEAIIGKGLAEIVYAISVDENEGTFKERERTYDERSSKWIDSNFPMMIGGVKVTIQKHDLKLDAEQMVLSDGNAMADGYAPVFLKASGSFEARYENDSGRSVRTSEVSADAGSALPLVATQAEMFKGLSSGPASMLSQMVMYELQSLAQYRVLVGFGSTYQNGDMGTNMILTESDVRIAYDNAVRTLNALCFRASSMDGVLKNSRIDLADILVGEDGMVEVDLSALYAQGLASMVDSMVLKIMDYMGVGYLMDLMDTFSDIVKQGVRLLVGCLTGNSEPFSAKPYIEAVMSGENKRGLNYATARSGETFNLKVSQAMLDEMGLKHSIESGTLREMNLKMRYPTVDLFGHNDIKNFKTWYDRNSNGVEGWLRSALSMAAIELAESKAFGTVRISLDEFDDKAFYTSISIAIRNAIADGSNVANIVKGSLSNQRSNDDFHSEILRAITMNASSIYKADTFELAIAGEVRAAFRGMMDDTDLQGSLGTTEYNQVRGKLSDEIEAWAKGNSVVDGIVSGYKGMVADILDLFKSLGQVEGKNPGILKNAVIGAMASDMRFIDLFVDVFAIVDTICGETENNVSISANSGVIELPGMDSFLLTDGSRNAMLERMDVEHSSRPTIIVDSPMTGKTDCYHDTALGSRTNASYLANFRVTLIDTLTYVVKGTNSITSSMGTHDSSYRFNSSVAMQMDIPVISGWGLAGVEYPPSNTLAGDVLNLVVRMLEPLLGPLMTLMGIMSDIVGIIGSATWGIAKYAADKIAQLYELLMRPIQILVDTAYLILDNMFSTVIGGVETFMHATLKGQSAGIRFMGFTITLGTNMGTWDKATKTLFSVEVKYNCDNLEIGCDFIAKRKGSNNYFVGEGWVKGKDWDVHVFVDPLMKTSKHIMAISGRANGLQVDVVFPDIEQYKRMTVSLSDIPAIGTAMSNIPTPIPGTLLSLDAGLEMRYNLPFKNAVVINEFESNPPGTDSNNEWIELFNATTTRANLDGYTLTPQSGLGKKVYTISNCEIGPGQRMVFEMPNSFLNNSSNAGSSKGEIIVLKDPTGRIVDSTPALKDTKNDSRSWQRVADAAESWCFYESTMGETNCGGVLNGELVKNQLIAIMKDVATRTMTKMKELNSMDDLSEFLKTVIVEFIDVSIERFSTTILEMAMFIKIEFKDVASMGCSGLDIRVLVDTEFVEEGLKYIAGIVEEMLLKIKNPYDIKFTEIFTENVYLGVTYYTGIQAPRFLGSTLDAVKLGINVKVNVASLTELFGTDTGRWKVVGGVLIANCPTELIPNDFKIDKSMNTDLWFLKVTVQEV